MYTTNEIQFTRTLPEQTKMLVKSLSCVDARHVRQREASQVRELRKNCFLCRVRILFVGLFFRTPLALTREHVHSNDNVDDLTNDADRIVSMVQ